MGRGVQKMLIWTRELCDEDRPDETLVRKVFHREEIMDNVQHEVIEFLTNLMTGEAPYSVTEESRKQLRYAGPMKSPLRLR